MAINTQLRRMSIAQLGGMTDFLPKPDGTVAPADRMNLLSLYSGFTSAGPGGGDTRPWWFIYTGGSYG